MKSMWAGAALVLMSGAAAAQSMNAQQFFNRATTIQKKGMLAVFSGGEIKKLMAEGQAAGLNARKQRQDAMSTGKPPRFCPPPGKVTMDNREFMQRLTAIPAADRARVDMTEAMTRILATKYPCK